jgi:hypothetical protein
VGWKGLKIREVVTRFSEGGSQTRPVIDVISIVTSAHKARRIVARPQSVRVPSRPLFH